MTAEVSPRKGSEPVAISYSTAPKENRSVRASSSFPRACSGDMYATVPTAVPGLVRCSSGTSVVSVEAAELDPGVTDFGGAASFAKPKSRFFPCPRLVTNRFADLICR